MKKIYIINKLVVYTFNPINVINENIENINLKKFCGFYYSSWYSKFMQKQTNKEFS